MSSYLIAGLGNIGAEYADTRHNIGFDVVAGLVAKHGGVLVTQRLAAVAEIKFKGRKLTCILPTTYMNLSGRAVKYWMDKEKIPLERILVVTDEIALPLSRVRLRGSGSAGGHNGLKSIQEELNTDQYARLRYGVGNQFPRGMQVEYVLGKWPAAEVPLLKKKNEKVVEMIESFSTAGLERTMNDFNKLEITL